MIPPLDSKQQREALADGLKTALEIFEIIRRGLPAENPLPKLELCSLLLVDAFGPALGMFPPQDVAGMVDQALVRIGQKSKALIEMKVSIATGRPPPGAQTKFRCTCCGAEGMVGIELKGRHRNGAKEGDLTACAMCQTVGKFNSKFEIIPFTTEELEAFKREEPLLWQTYRQFFSQLKLRKEAQGE